jgi:hypothetical protein
MWGIMVSLIGAVYYVVWAPVVDPVSPGLLLSSDAPFPNEYFCSCNCIPIVANTPRPCAMHIIITSICLPPI